MPELGSPEAAVQAAVNLLAAVTKLDERKLAYWLDMYYQLRSRYDAEQAQRRFFEMYGPKSPNGATPFAADLTEDATPQSPPEEAATASLECRAARQDAPLAGEPEAGPPAVPDGGEVSPVPESPAAKAAQEKRRIRERFMQARSNGVTLGAIRKAANGGITEESLRDIIESKPVPVEVYRVLDKALDQMEQ